VGGRQPALGKDGDPAGAAGQAPHPGRHVAPLGHVPSSLGPGGAEIKHTGRQLRSRMPVLPGKGVSIPRKAPSSSPAELEPSPCQRQPQPGPRPEETPARVRAGARAAAWLARSGQHGRPGHGRALGFPAGAARAPAGQRPHRSRKGKSRGGEGGRLWEAEGGRWSNGKGTEREKRG